MNARSRGHKVMRRALSLVRSFRLPIATYAATKPCKGMPVHARAQTHTLSYTHLPGHIRGIYAVLPNIIGGIAPVCAALFLCSAAHK